MQASTLIVRAKSSLLINILFIKTFFHMLFFGVLGALSRGTSIFKCCFNLKRGYYSFIFLFIAMNLCTFMSLLVIWCSLNDS